MVSRFVQIRKLGYFATNLHKKGPRVELLSNVVYDLTRRPSWCPALEVILKLVEIYEGGSAVAHSTDIPQKGARHDTGNTTTQTHDDCLQSLTRPGVVGRTCRPDSRDRQGELGSLSSRIGRHGGRDNYAAGA